jgi:hypothetical protein
MGSSDGHPDTLSHRLTFDVKQRLSRIGGNDWGLVAQVAIQALR